MNPRADKRPTVARHQANHARLLALRTEADTLEAQLKSSVSALAGLRKELSSTPATVFPAESRPVPFDELLLYAKSISRYTVPPTFREQRGEDVDGTTETGAQAETQTEGEANTQADAPSTNGLNTPTLPTTEAATSSAADPTADPATDPPAIPAPSDEDSLWLQKLKSSNFAWFPWPDADKIRRGNLWKLYHYREQGRDLAAFDVEAYEEEERKKFSDEYDESGGGAGQMEGVVEGAGAGAGAVPIVGGAAEVKVQAQGQGQGQGHVQAPAQAQAQAQAKGGFTLFDDLEESDEE